MQEYVGAFENIRSADLIKCMTKLLRDGKSYFADGIDAGADR